MMKSSTLFKCGPLPPTYASHPPDVIHVTGVPRPSPFFATLLLLCIALNANQRTKNGGGLGTRLMNVALTVCIQEVVRGYNLDSDSRFTGLAKCVATYSFLYAGKRP